MCMIRNSYNEAAAPESSGGVLQVASDFSHCVWGGCNLPSDRLGVLNCLVSMEQFLSYKEFRTRQNGLVGGGGVGARLTVSPVFKNKQHTRVKNHEKIMMHSLFLESTLTSTPPIGWVRWPYGCVTCPLLDPEFPLVVNILLSPLATCTSSDFQLHLFFLLTLWVSAKSQFLTCHEELFCLFILFFLTFI